jgi:hypothetical protein
MTPEQLAQVRAILSRGLALSDERRLAELKSLPSQKVKDRLFVLIGKPENVGKRNTPPGAGAKMADIIQTVWRLECARIRQVFGA